MGDLCILKIGGSVITQKGIECSARTETMERISEEIERSIKGDLVIVHGAGSFGHIQAEKYDLNSNFDSKGILVTHNAVKELNRIFIDSLSRKGLPIAPVHPMSCVTLEAGRISSFFLEQIKLILENEMIPVLHGDVVFDKSVGVRILSGDQQVTYLAKSLNAKSVGLGSNVDGILVDGKVLEKITPDTFEDFKDNLSGSESVDVTGGMLGKVSELIDLAKSDISSCIFNASQEGGVERFLNGDSIGTIVSSC
ncbi:MAG: isopentenyl phosphate kinase [Halobacteriota archaeon]|nr:isopentenyl phosphate kinase [Halobacteriota archaeon]